jgi:hypothetical protein
VFNCISNCSSIFIGRSRESGEVPRVYTSPIIENFSLLPAKRGKFFLNLRYLSKKFVYPPILGLSCGHWSSYMNLAKCSLYCCFIYDRKCSTLISICNFEVLKEIHAVKTSSSLKTYIVVLVIINYRLKVVINK